jgi:hypothetical protein
MLDRLVQLLDRAAQQIAAVGAVEDALVLVCEAAGADTLPGRHVAIRAVAAGRVRAGGPFPARFGVVGGRVMAEVCEAARAVLRGAAGRDDDHRDAVAGGVVDGVGDDLAAH